jgi:Xaa-Pro aminopeptidase
MSAAEIFLSKIPALPLLRRFSPPADKPMERTYLDGYLRAQNLAQQAARELAGWVQPGWTEARTADLLNTYLLDHGVASFFHKAFVWFGDRTRFAGVKNYSHYSPTHRVVREGEVFILDVAPIVDGYICDIGYTASLGENLEFEKARAVLSQLHQEIPLLFKAETTGGEICENVAARIRDAGYEPIHQKYPFAVLGHRVHRSRNEYGQVTLLNFGWQSYWEFLSRGLFGQLLNAHYEGKLEGLWAIEPHIGGPGFGAKFEQLLWVQDGKAEWLGESLL